MQELTDTVEVTNINGGCNVLTLWAPIYEPSVDIPVRLHLTGGVAFHADPRVDGHYFRFRWVVWAAWDAATLPASTPALYTLPYPYPAHPPQHCGLAMWHIRCSLLAKILPKPACEAAKPALHQQEACDLNAISMRAAPHFALQVHWVVGRGGQEVPA